MQVQAEQDERDDEDGGQRDAQTDQSVLPNGQILFVEDVEDAVGEDFNLAAVGAQRQRNVVGDDARLLHGRIEVVRRLEHRVVRHEVVGAHPQLAAGRAVVDERLRVGGVTAFGALHVGIVLQEGGQPLFERLLVGQDAVDEPLRTRLALASVFSINNNKNR